MLKRSVRQKTEQASSYITPQHRIVLTMKLIVINILWWQRRTYYIGRQLRIWAPSREKLFTEELHGNEEKGRQEKEALTTGFITSRTLKFRKKPLERSTSPEVFC